jgi:hybrid cluster-associated redox disulfide protein
MKKPIKRVTKKTNIAKLVYEHPETVEVFMDYGLHCVGCPASGADSLEAGAKIHGLADKEIVELVGRVNEVIKFEE